MNPVEREDLARLVEPYGKLLDAKMSKVKRVLVGI